MSYKLMLDCSNRLIVHDLLRPCLMESPCPTQWGWGEVDPPSSSDGTVSWTGSELSAAATLVPSGDGGYASSRVDLDCMVALPCGVTGLKATASFSNTEDVTGNFADIVAHSHPMLLSAFPGESLTAVAPVPEYLFYRFRLRLTIWLETADADTTATGTVNFQCLYT